MDGVFKEIRSSFSSFQDRFSNPPDPSSQLHDAYIMKDGSSEEPGVEEFDVAFPEPPREGSPVESGPSTDDWECIEEFEAPPRPGPVSKSQVVQQRTPLLIDILLGQCEEKKKAMAARELKAKVVADERYALSILPDMLSVWSQSSPSSPSTLDVINIINITCFRSREEVTRQYSMHFFNCLKILARNNFFSKIPKNVEEDIVCLILFFIPAILDSAQPAAMDLSSSLFVGDSTVPLVINNSKEDRGAEDEQEGEEEDGFEAVEEDDFSSDDEEAPAPIALHKVAIPILVELSTKNFNIASPIIDSLSVQRPDFFSNADDVLTLLRQYQKYRPQQLGVLVSLFFDQHPQVFSNFARTVALKTAYPSSQEEEAVPTPIQPTQYQASTAAATLKIVKNSLYLDFWFQLSRKNPTIVERFLLTSIMPNVFADNESLASRSIPLHDVERLVKLSNILHHVALGNPEIAFQALGALLPSTAPPASTPELFSSILTGRSVSRPFHMVALENVMMFLRMGEVGKSVALCKSVIDVYSVIGRQLLGEVEVVRVIHRILDFSTLGHEFVSVVLTGLYNIAVANPRVMTSDMVGSANEERESKKRRKKKASVVSSAPSGTSSFLSKAENAVDLSLFRKYTEDHDVEVREMASKLFDTIEGNKEDLRSNSTVVLGLQSTIDALNLKLAEQNLQMAQMRRELTELCNTVEKLKEEIEDEE